MFDEPYIAPVILTFPDTCSCSLGAVVAIPTLPVTFWISILVRPSPVPPTSLNVKLSLLSLNTFVPKSQPFSVPSFRIICIRERPIVPLPVELIFIKDVVVVLILAVPETSSLKVGLVVPIPTLPALSITIFVVNALCPVSNAKPVKLVPKT